MGFRDWLQLLIYLVLLLAISVPFAGFMEKVFKGEKNILSPLLGPIERILYKISGTHPDEEQSWQRYAGSVLGFSIVSGILTYLLLRFQQILPLNPQSFPELPTHLTLNTAISFLTNTNWQSYGGETTMSYLSQMGALTFQNFMSAAVGMAACVAVIRGIARREAKGIGNFWADLVRGTLYILLPLSFVFAVVLISQGIIQNFSAYTQITTLEGAKQIIAQGPVASQVAIKMLGTNGGGFFNVNAAHPFENPNAVSNFLQILSIFLIPSSLVFLLGRMTKSPKHGWSVWAAMAIVFALGTVVCAHYEYKGNPLFTQLGLASPLNMEGKEVRFGIFNSSMFATITTDASCGAVNAMHDSFTPLGGIVPLVNMKLGEIIFGGVGSGLYGMILFVILSVFIAGLMVGRTPEYLGKRIEGREVKFVILACIFQAIAVLSFTAIAVRDPRGLAGLNNPAAHGFSEILYAFTSATQNNGSAFAGLTANTPFYNLTLAVCMWVGRFFVMLPMLAVAGSLASKKHRPESASTFPVHGATFVALLLGVIFIVGALTYMPALALGPVLEHLQMLNGQLY